MQTDRSRDIAITGEGIRSRKTKIILWQSERKRGWCGGVVVVVVVVKKHERMNGGTKVARTYQPDIVGSYWRCAGAGQHCCWPLFDRVTPSQAPRLPKEKRARILFRVAA